MRDFDTAGMINHAAVWDDTLSDEVILSELREMSAANGLPYVEVFASVK